MSTDTEKRKQLYAGFSDKVYRDAFVRESIAVGLAFQIRANREFRKWSQAKLGREANGMTQAFISRLEDPTYGKMTLSTLLEIASAFDVALLVKLVPFRKLAEFSSSISESDLVIEGYEAEAKIVSAIDTADEIDSTLTDEIDVQGTPGASIVSSSDYQAVPRAAGLEMLALPKRAATRAMPYYQQ